MPPKLLPKVRLSNYIEEFGEEIFKVDENVLYCKPCDKTIIGAADRRCVVTQHLETDRHRYRLNRKRTSKQSILNQFTAPTQEFKQAIFNKMLCDAFITADIPLNKLLNLKLKETLEQYTGLDVLTPTAYRQTYISKLCTESIREMQKDLKGHYLWIGMDELCDSTGRTVAAFLVGKLDPNGFEKPYLAHMEQLEKINHQTIAASFNHALMVLHKN
jgi:hypothetical protein